MRIKFHVEGMMCAACSASVEKVTSRLEGVTKAEVNLLAKTLFVECDEASDKLSEKILQAVEKAGFSATTILEGGKAAPKRSDGDKREEKASREMKIRLFASLFFLVLLMYLSMGHMIGLPIPSIFHGTENLLIFSFTQFLLTLPIIYLNRKFFRIGFPALFRRAPNMDSLVAVGSSAAILYGIFAIFMIGFGLGHGDFQLAEQYGKQLYFESAAMILTLVTVGKYLEESAKKKTGAAIEKLSRLSPETALVNRGGKLIELPTEELLVGDLILVKPGQSIPADGVIVEGESTVDESALTGESLPVLKTAGDSVKTATINQKGFFTFRAEQVGGDTALSRMIELVRDAGATKAPISRLADRVAAVFVPVVMTLALITFIIWLILGKSFDFALSSGISVLVISCPCALGLATPVAVTVSIGRLAGQGILVKSAETLEILHETKTVVLDKTGTVTEGDPTVTDVISEKKEELLTLAASLEKVSEHPLAQAILTYTEKQGISAKPVSAFVSVPGRGVRGEVDGESVSAGNAAFFDELAVKVPDSLEKTLEDLSLSGKTPMLFAKGSEYLGLIAVADPIKKTSREAVSLLRQLGVKTLLLTGDRQKTAEAIAAEAGIPEVIAEVTPEEKEQKVRELTENGGKREIVTFVGDGINDSPALARADVGIAIGSGTDIAVDSADIVFMKNDLVDLPAAIDFSRKTIVNIRQNLFWAFFYNSLGIPIAAGVLSPLGITLSPMIAAAAMSVSSLFVVTNALRLNTKKMIGRADQTK